MPFHPSEPTLAAWQMPELIGAVEYVSAHRVLSPRYSRQTAYDLAFTPYHVDPLRCLEDESTEFVTLLFASQTGKTTLLENAAFFLFAMAPAPMIWALPGLKSRDDFLSERLRPTINACPKFKEMLAAGGRSITQEGIAFRAAPLFLALADSESDLASRTCKYVIADEIDKFPKQTTNEGSPLSQLRKRQRTFRGYGAKFLQSSTPTDPQGAIWQEFLSSDRREWFVPCPSCGALHQWEMRDVRWDPPADGVTKMTHSRDILSPDSSIRVWWECPKCEHQAEGQRVQNSMNDAGRFIAQAPYHGHAGFRVPSMASKLPACSWRSLAAELLLAFHDRERGDERRLQVFANHEEARPYTHKKREMGESSVVARVDEKAARGIVPSWAHIVTLGVDVQSDRFVWIASAWRSNTRGAVIDHGEVGGWDELQDVIARVWPQEGTARNFQPCFVLIDSGDGLMTGDVYQFCSRMDRGRGQILPVKGSSAGLNTYHRMSIRDSIKNRKGHITAKETLVLIDTMKVKDFLAACLDRPVGNDAAFSFHDEVGEDSKFQRQIVSEERGKDPKSKTNRTIWKTRDGYEANHYWDALVYATTGAIMRGILRGGGRIHRNRRPAPESSPNPQSPISNPQSHAPAASPRPRPRHADPWGRGW